MSKTHDAHPEVEKTEARQSERILGMPKVLGISTLLALALLLAIFLIYAI